MSAEQLAVRPRPQVGVLATTGESEVKGSGGSRGDRGSTRATAGHRASRSVRWKIKAIKSLLSTCMDLPHISLFPLQRALQSKGVCPVCLNCAGGRLGGGGDCPVIQKY